MTSASEATEARINIGEIVLTTLHTPGHFSDSVCYWNKKNKLGVCGDWFLGPKAENSFLSANSLYNEIK